MKKALLGISALGVLFAASCEKNRDTPAPIPDYSNTWKLAGTTYTAASTAASTASGYWQLSAATTSNSGNINHGITFLFNTSTPPKPGVYLVTPGQTGDTGSVRVMAANNNGFNITTYYPTGFDSIRAVVNVSDSGKVTIDLPPTWVLNTNPNIVDSTKLSAISIKQP